MTFGQHFRFLFIFNLNMLSIYFGSSKFRAFFVFRRWWTLLNLYNFCTERLTRRCHDKLYYLRYLLLVIFVQHDFYSFLHFSHYHAILCSCANALIALINVLHSLVHLYWIFFFSFSFMIWSSKIQRSRSISNSSSKSSSICDTNVFCYCVLVLNQNTIDLINFNIRDTSWIVVWSF